MKTKEYYIKVFCYTESLCKDESYTIIYSTTINKKKIDVDMLLDILNEETPYICYDIEFVRSINDYDDDIENIDYLIEHIFV